MNGMNVLVCGSSGHHYPIDAEVVRARIRALPDGSVVIHGRMEGVETIAAEEAAKRGFETIRIDYTKFNPFHARFYPQRINSPIRVNHVLAFYDGVPGNTHSMVEGERAAGISVETMPCANFKADTKEKETEKRFWDGLKVPDMREQSAGRVVRPSADEVACRPRFGHTYSTVDGKTVATSFTEEEMRAARALRDKRAILDNLYAPATPDAAKPLGDSPSTLVLSGKNRAPVVPGPLHTFNFSEAETRTLQQAITALAAKPVDQIVWTDKNVTVVPGESLSWSETARIQTAEPLPDTDAHLAPTPLSADSLPDRIRLFCGGEFLRYQRPEAASAAAEVAHDLRDGRPLDKRRVRKVLGALDLSRESAAQSERMAIFSALREQPWARDREQRMRDQVQASHRFAQELRGVHRRVPDIQTGRTPWPADTSIFRDVPRVIEKPAVPVAYCDPPPVWRAAVDTGLRLLANLRPGEPTYISRSAPDTATLTLLAPMHVPGCRRAIGYVEPNHIDQYMQAWNRFQDSKSLDQLPNVHIRNHLMHVLGGHPGRPSLEIVSAEGSLLTQPLPADIDLVMVGKGLLDRNGATYSIFEKMLAALVAQGAAAPRCVVW